jgi:hypothetical protein
VLGGVDRDGRILALLGEFHERVRQRGGYLCLFEHVVGVETGLGVDVDHECPGGGVVLIALAELCDALGVEEVGSVRHADLPSSASNSVAQIEQTCISPNCGCLWGASASASQSRS